LTSKRQLARTWFKDRTGNVQICNGWDELIATVPLEQWNVAGSRDALKLHRPTGIAFSLIGSDAGYKAIYFFDCQCFTSPHERLASETLAELHAIVQILNYMDSKNG
jgi:hypothetical protein